MSWQPENSNLNQLLTILRDAISPSNKEQAILQQRLLRFNEYAEYNSYLVYILVKMIHEDGYTRAIAGLTLKNNLLNHFNLTPLVTLNYVKQVSLEALDHPDPDSTVRRAIGSVITAIVVRGQVLNWPESIHALINKLDSPEPLAVEMALDTLQKICEDNMMDMNDDINKSMLDQIIYKLIPFSSHPIPRFRVLAISAISYSIPHKSPSLLKHMDDFLRSLFFAASDETVQVRQEVCRSFIMLLDNFTNHVLPHLEQMIEYMIYCNQSENSQIALEASEFWNRFANIEHLHHYLIPYLPRTIPVILKSLEYTEEDLLAFGDYDEGDEEQTLLLPRYRRKHSGIQIHNDDDEEEDLEDDDEDDVEDDGFFSVWTLRKYSATSLEALTMAFKSHVVTVLLPLLDQSMFHSQQWKTVESGILALGAAAEGGMNDLTPHLPVLIPFLVTNLSSPNVYIRYISCWTISRFSSWLLSQCDDQESRSRYFEPALRELLRRILDRNIRVQEAACSAFSILEEQATSKELVPYLPVILNHLTRALRLYGNRNLRLLYDTLGTLAESVGSALNDPQCISVLMPPLISKWNSLVDTDHHLFPLLACLTDIATSLGTGFLPFTEPVFSRCVLLVTNILQTAVLDGEDEFDDEWISTPLDLLSGIVQGLGSQVEPFVKNSTLLPLLTVCSHYHSRCEILQPTYALIGDLAKACFSCLEPYLEKMMPELLREIGNDDLEYMSVRNNAIWAVGEIAVRWQKIRDYMPDILPSCIPLIGRSTHIQENVINTIGRLGLTSHQFLAQYLPLIGYAWLRQSKSIKETEEKDTAFQGFCKAVDAYPQGLSQEAIYMLFDIIHQWQQPSDDLQVLFKRITNNYNTLYFNK
ncbi:hypothetical protein CU097_003083 [Rhizopus azygosporus]|uniref:Importin N-terminal domain-containing protein n=1 Tax=Rhizopus azygosporus TaxID=86630 RepID=A0A367J7V1_RHIAZ|nr:hypothetical protein CU097_003083 [Rhizopus azygosporus]